MNKIKTATAVVVGHDHQNTLGIIRSLGEDGFCVKAVFVSDGGFCASACSKYIDVAFVIQPNELIDTLLALGAQLGGQVPLIPCGDDTAAPIAQAYEHLKEWYILPCAEDGSNMLRLMNKMEMLEAARSAGLAVPNWVCLKQQDFADTEKCCGHLQFPCILKPVRLLPGGTFRFVIMQSMEELRAALDYINSNCETIIIQEYVRKTGEYGVNGCRLHKSGKTVFGGIIEKKRFSQSSMGSTTAGNILPDTHGLCDAVQRFVEYIDYRGIFDVEFVFDGKTFYFVEMNFRNGGYGYAYTRAGRNFPAIWAREACGEDAEAYLRKAIKPVFFINESADLQNVKTGEISVLTWFWDVLRANAHMYINRRDMQPLVKKIMRK